MWKDDLLAAMMTSPTALTLFKAKQSNKRHCDQVINSLWAYKTEKIVNPDVRWRKPKTKSIERLITEFSSINVNMLLEADKRKEPIKLNTPIQGEMFFNLHSWEENELFKLMNKMKTLKREVLNRYKLFSFERCGRSVDNIHLPHSASYFEELLNTLFSKDIYIVIPMFDNIKGAKFWLKCKNKFIAQLKEFVQLLNKAYNKKLKSMRKNYINVGIEIEYDGTKTPNDIQHRILENGCISFDSGYDGNYAVRLRENRIRLNGIAGFKGLYILLEYMKENDKLAKNSSVHMHIDCGALSGADAKFHNRNNRKPRTMDIYNNATKLTIDNFKLLCDTFEIDLGINTQYFGFFVDNMRWNDHFDTVEFRFCMVSLNYTDYIYQMLILIHIINCARYQLPINTKYLKKLKEIKDKI